MIVIHTDAVPETAVSHNPEIAKRVLIANGRIPFLTNLSVATFRPGQVASAHAHDDMHEVFFVERGVGTFTIDGVEHVAAPGTCVAIDPGEVHEVANRGGDDLVVRYFGIAPGAGPSARA